MSRQRRPPRPGHKQPPEYLIRILRVCHPKRMEDLLAVGRYYGGRNADGDPVWVPLHDRSWRALRMRGAGLASAVRALNRLGYLVERVAA